MRNSVNELECSLYTLSNFDEIDWTYRQSLLMSLQCNRSEWNAQTCWGGIIFPAAGTGNKEL